MIKNYLTNLCIALLFLFSAVGYSQNCTPINVTGFNVDVVAEAAPAASKTTATLDVLGTVMHSQSYGIATGVGYGLLDSGYYTSGTTSYKLQPYTQNNSFTLTAGQTGALTFVTPSSYSKISLLGFNSEQTGGFSYVINFSDGTTFSGNGAYPDWYGGASPVAIGIGNIMRSNDTGGTHDGNNPRLYKIDISLTGVNAYKNIANITFTSTAAGAQRMNILAVSGISNVQNTTGLCSAVVNYSLPNLDGSIALPKVLLLGTCPTPSFMTDVQAKLVATGQFSTVDTFNTFTGTPTLALLNQYNSVLAWTQYDPQDKVALGDVLVQYIDEGHGVVDAFATTIDFRIIGGNFNTNTYGVLQASTNYNVVGNISLGIVNIPTHPIMQGITNFGLLNGGYYSVGNVLNTNSYTIARYSNNEPIVCAKENVGPLNARRATLNFFPPSNTASSIGWDSSTQGAQLMANALTWVSYPYTQIAGLSSGSVFPVGTTTNTFTYHDVNNVLQTYSFDITVKDTELPVAITQNITAQLDATGNATITPAQVNNVSTDNCTISTYSLDKTTFTCTDLGPNTVTLTVTDASGNTDTETAVVTIADTVAPTVITQNINAQLTAAGTVTITAAQVNNGSTDNCTIASYSVTPSTFTCANVGPNTVTLTVTDSKGNIGTNTAIVTVQDVTAPVAITQNATIQLNSAGNVTVTVAQVNNASTDNCSIVTYAVSPNTFTCANVGPNTVTLTVTDASGNTDTETAIVTIQDASGPSVTTQNVTVQLDANGIATINAAQVNNGSSDGCGIASMSVSPSNFTCANVGPNTVTLTVTDVNGNIGSNTATVTVQDTVLPNVLTQNITVQLNAAGTVTITPAQVNNGSTDNCSIASYSVSPNSFTCANVGPNTVTLTVTDANGNINTNTAVVTVQDTTLPTVLTQGITVPLDATGNATITPAQVNNGSTDNCTIASYGVSPTSFTCANVGPNTVTLTVTDVNGNSATGTATVTVQDTVLPTVLTQNITVQLNPNGVATITPAQVNNSSIDNCGIASMSVSPANFTCANVGPNTVTLTVTDVNGNVNTNTATVTVQDTVLPTVLTQNITIQLNTNGIVGIVPAQVDNASTDNCAISSYTVSPNSFTCANVGPNTVTLTVTDVNGNVNTNTAVVTVQDNTPPTVLTQDITVQLDATGNVTITPAQINNASTDNCSIASYALNTTSFTCANVGLNTVTLSVTDVNGNTASAIATVTVQDTVLPTVVTQNITVQLNPNGVATITPAQINNGSTDNCSIAIYALDITNFTCANVGPNTVTLTVTDVNGNVNTNTATVTVQDTVLPTVLTQNINVPLDATGNATITPAQINNGSTDNCSIATYALSTTAFTCANVGPNTVTLTVTDVNGNVNTNTAIVTVQDLIAPTVTSQDITVQLNGATGTVTITPAQVIAAANDNCSYVATLNTSTFNCTNVGPNTVTVTVTDPSGNIATATATVTVQSTLAVTPNTTQVDVLCYGNATGTATVAVTGGSGLYTYLWNNGQTTQTATGLVAGNYNVIVTDSNGCTIQHSFTITQPATPVTTSATHTDVLCYNATTGTATVNASGGTGAYTYHWNTTPVQTTATATNLHAGTYTVIVTDANGCTSSQTQTITQPSSPVTATTAQTNVTCFGNGDGTITVTAAGGVGSYTYTWVPAVSTTNTATALTPGNYKITITDANGCSTVKTVNISQPQLLTGTVHSTNADCFDSNNGTASITVTGGTTPYTYLWSNGSTTASVANLTPGAHSVVVTDAHGCTFTGSVTVTEPLQIIITAQPVDYDATPEGTAMFHVEDQNGWAYIWHVSKDNGNTWELVENGGYHPHYVGAQTNTLYLSNVTADMTGYLYRARVFQIGTCLVYADPALLNADNSLGNEEFTHVDFNIYPNPASTEVNVTIPEFSSNQNVRFTMFDLNGRLVRNEQITSETSKFDVTGLESGVYIINITSDKGTTIKKLIVDKKL